VVQTQSSEQALTFLLMLVMMMDDCGNPGGVATLIGGGIFGGNMFQQQAGVGFQLFVGE